MSSNTFRLFSRSLFNYKSQISEFCQYKKGRKLEFNRNEETEKELQVYRSTTES